MPEAGRRLRRWVARAAIKRLCPSLAYCLHALWCTSQGAQTLECARICLRCETQQLETDNNKISQCQSFRSSLLLTHKMEHITSTSSLTRSQQDVGHALSPAAAQCHRLAGNPGHAGLLCNTPLQHGQVNTCNSYLQAQPAVHQHRRYQLLHCGRRPPQHVGVATPPAHKAVCKRPAHTNAPLG